MSRSFINILAFSFGFISLFLIGLASAGAENYICTFVDEFGSCTQWAIDSSVRLQPLTSEEGVSLALSTLKLWATAYVLVKLQDLL